MSNAQRRLPQYRLGITREDFILLGLVVAVQVGGYLAYTNFGLLPLEPPEQKVSTPLGGGKLVALVIVESIALVAIYKGWCRIPERIRKVLKKAPLVVCPPIIIAVSYASGIVWPIYALAATAGFVGVVWLLERVELDWMIHNGLALGLGVLVTAMLAKALQPAAVLAFLVGMIAWDRTAVDLSGWMDKLISASAGAGIPNYFVIPTGWQMDFDRFEDWLSADDRGEKPDDVKLLIGVGDFVLPALLAITAATVVSDGGMLPAAGAFVGTCIGMLRVSAVVRQRDSGVPALPWVNTGAIAGFSVGVLLSDLPILVALGVA